MLSILIVDPYPIIRKGIRTVVEEHDDWEVCGEACSEQEVLASAFAHAPDVVVLDSLALMNGVLDSLTCGTNGAAILLYTTRSDSYGIQEGIAAGARGYVLKSDSAINLEAGIAALARGRPYFSPTVSDELLSAGMFRSKRSKARLTDREIEVAQLIAEGLSNRAIASQLGRSVKTVESHRASAMRKAGVRSAADFIRFVVRNKLVAV